MFIALGVFVSLMSWLRADQFRIGCVGDTARMLDPSKHLGVIEVGAECRDMPFGSRIYMFIYEAQPLIVVF